MPEPFTEGSGISAIQPVGWGMTLNTRSTLCSGICVGSHGNGAGYQIKRPRYESPAEASVYASRGSTTISQRRYHDGLLGRPRPSRLTKPPFTLYNVSDINKP